MLGLAFTFILAFAFGFGVFSKLPTFDSNDYSDARALAIAQVITEQHQAAVRYIEEEDASGIRIHATVQGPIAIPASDGISYNYSAFGMFPTYRVAGATSADWATVTWITPQMQVDLKNNSPYPTMPETMLRDIIEISGNSQYTIGVYQNGHIEPLDRTSDLQAPSDTPWSPMDDRDPSTIPGTPGVDKPATKVNWVHGSLPQLDVVPPGLVDGSWVIMTMTPST